MYPTELEAALNARTSVSRDDETPFGAYLNAIANSLCPYLKPSMDASALYLSVYSVPTALTDNADIGAFVFYYGFLHSEWLRRARAIGDERRRALLCDNEIGRASCRERV